MRAFLILCLSAVALAAPQGYSYNQPISSVGSVGSVGSIGSIGSYGSYSTGGGVAIGGGSYQQEQHHAPIVTKHFHSFSAPEEQEDESIHRVLSTGPSHKHYRVVFIKAPHQNAASAAVSVAQAANEEKTVIYVLSRKTDAADIQAQIQAAPFHPTKPEVFFIKYKTPEEAVHAQHTIQTQYDSLGGTSQVTDEGLAPVQSVIGSLGASDHGISGSGTHTVATSGAYLPPN